ncbi:hypothetical protein E2562_020645 [Oryza meyeriana var. granulata]|uniref:Uncharacterized protein n=1 Tax=Oryza meyeriana var. granulata TaxID=110450 RepID=A0A6G1EAZ0_9ORYZ|nr:hypothetical protein E2562_020645 [Oryza meyeriana var. granulata]
MREQCRSLEEAIGFRRETQLLAPAPRSRPRPLAPHHRRLQRPPLRPHPEPRRRPR